jgi:RNA polymerase sigma-70 factor, ECF subfamily
MTVSVLRSGLLTALPGDAEAVAAQTLTVAEVYAQHASYVFRCLRSLGVRESHVEDAVQDVFLVVHDKLAYFDGAAKLRTWLFAIVIRIARRYRERQAREAREPANDALDLRSAEQTLLSLEQLALARKALEALSDEKREVFVLAEIEQLSAPEIATITACPLNTVYSRLRAARAEFDRRVQQLARERERRLR